jgi:hypothetical protein
MVNRIFERFARFLEQGCRPGFARRVDTGDISGVIHAFNENGPASVIDNHYDASQMMALGLHLSRCDHLARRC